MELNNEELELKRQIKELNEDIENFFQPMRFTLNKTLLEKQTKLHDLIKSCHHRYCDGICLICGSEESNGK